VDGNPTQGNVYFRLSTSAPGINFLKA